MTRQEALSHEILYLQGRDGQIAVKVLGVSKQNEKYVNVCLKNAQPGHGVFSVSPERLQAEVTK